MAGSDIYIGEIISDLNTKLDAVKLSLDSVNANSAASIQKLNVIGSANLKKTLANILADVIVFASAYDYSTYNFKSLCDGSIRVDVDVKREVATGTTSVLLKCGATEKLVQLTAAAGVYQTVSLTGFAVKFNDVITLGIRGTVSSPDNKKVTFKENSIKIYYDIVNLVNDGAVLLL